MTEQLRSLVDAGVLADIDRYFGESLLDLGATADVALSAAAVSAMYRAGHTCLPLAEAGKPVAEVVPRIALDDEELPDAASRVRLPSVAAWRDALAASPVVASDGISEPPRPLVVDQDRLYLHRLHHAERRLASRMLALATRQTPNPVPEPVAASFAELPAGAAKAAMDGLCIVTGGPGTGKTTLAASLIAFLVAADAGSAFADRPGRTHREGRHSLAGGRQDPVRRTRPP